MTKSQEPDPVGSHKGGLVGVSRRFRSLDCAAVSRLNRAECLRPLHDDIFSFWELWHGAVHLRGLAQVWAFSLFKSRESEGGLMSKDSSPEGWRAGEQGAFAKAVPGSQGPSIST